MRLVISNLVFSLLTFLLVGCAGGGKSILQSPNNWLSVKVGQSDKGHLFYSFYANDEMVIDSSRLGYRLKDGNEFPAKGWIVTKKEKTSVDGKWHPVWGKRSVVADRYNQLTLWLENKNKQSGINKLAVEFRLYDDGLAFRYLFPEGEDEAAECELTQFNYVADPTAWFYNGEHENYGPVLLSKVDAVRPSNVTLRVSDTLFLNLHEACLEEGDPLRLASSKGKQFFFRSVFSWRIW